MLNLALLGIHKRSKIANEYKNYSTSLNGKEI